MLAPDQSQFEKLFPFHLAVNDGLVIVQAGPALIKVASSTLVGRPLTEAFEVTRPTDFQLSMANLRQAEAMPFVLRAPGPGLQLKGQWLPDASNPSTLIFVCTAQISELSEIRRPPGAERLSLSEDRPT